MSDFFAVLFALTWLGLCLWFPPLGIVTIILLLVDRP